MFFIRGRNAWRAPSMRVSYQSTRSIHTLVVHHTVTTPAYTIAAAKQQLRAIDAMHRARGWSGIGYNVVIDRYGRCWEARGLNSIGAGATGHNTGYLHVAFLGDYTKIRATLRQRMAFRALKLRLRAKGFRFRRTCGHNQLSGHRTNACPGTLRRDLRLR